MSNQRSSIAPRSKVLQDSAEDSIAVIIERMRGFGEKPALFQNGRTISYRELMRTIDRWVERLQASGITKGSVCSVIADYSLEACGFLYASMLQRAIVVPLTNTSAPNLDPFIKIAAVEHLVRLQTNGEPNIERLHPAAPNELIERFRVEGKPGLVVFSSGSTGEPKGILHDFERVMRKFVAVRQGWRTVLFLMFDHFGGINTLLSTFAYGGVGVCLETRNPDVVCRSIESARATLLPTTPTFLNLLLTSGAHRIADLSSVELITYGTEVMPPSTLEKVRGAFPNAQLKQTYGLSELGVLRSKSEDDTSTWFRIGGDGFQVKVKEGVLWVRSEANMVGYLNALNPFDDEGWLCTGDEVEVRGDYVRILGRKTDLINVGGQKVYPAEVESVLLQAPNVLEAAVFGAAHPLMGRVVHARVALSSAETATALNERLRKFCLERLARYKVPLRFLIVDRQEQHSARFKKVR